MYKFTIESMERYIIVKGKLYKKYKSNKHVTKGLFDFMKEHLLIAYLLRTSIIDTTMFINDNLGYYTMKQITGANDYLNDNRSVYYLFERFYPKPIRSDL